MSKTETSLDVTRRSDGMLQLSINVTDADGSSHGHRIAGPKFDGSGKTLLRKVLDVSEAEAIRSYLDAVKAHDQ